MAPDPAGAAQIRGLPRSSLISPPREEAASHPGRDHAIVSLSRRQLRTLRRIERDLADSDPCLEAFYQGFARRTRGYDFSWLEKVDRRRFRIFSWRHE